MTLTPQQKETAMYAELVRCAELGLTCPTADWFAELLGGEEGGSISTTVLVMHRLEQRGLIQVRRFQRSRQVMITATGKSTAEPRNKSPHWRTRSQEQAA